MTKRCILLCRHVKMEALHDGEGNGHPHRPPTLAVHMDRREVAECLPSEMIHLPTIVPYKH